MFCYEYRDRCLLETPESSHGVVDPGWRWESGGKSQWISDTASLTLPCLALGCHPRSRSLHLCHHHQSCSLPHSNLKSQYCADTVLDTVQTVGRCKLQSLIQHLKFQRCPLHLHSWTYTSQSTLLAMGCLGLFGRLGGNKMVSWAILSDSLVF